MGSLGSLRSSNPLSFRPRGVPQWALQFFKFFFSTVIFDIEIPTDLRSKVAKCKKREKKNKSLKKVFEDGSEQWWGWWPSGTGAARAQTIPSLAVLIASGFHWWRGFYIYRVEGLGGEDDGSDQILSFHGRHVS